MATAKPKTLKIRRKKKRDTGALHTSVGRVNQEPVDVPEDEAQTMIDMGLAELVRKPAKKTQADDDTAGPDAPAAA